MVRDEPLLSAHTPSRANAASSPARLITPRLLTASALLCSACSERTQPVGERTSWAVNPIPLLEISDDDPGGEVVLGVAAHVTRLPDGGVLVSDRGLHSLRFFGPDGRFQRAVGRQGSGPGEFEYIRVAHRCGDSLYVEDIVTRRVMVYALDGTLARTLSTGEFAGGADAFQSACNADGLFVHHAWGRAFDPETRGRQRDLVAVWLTSAAGTRVAELNSVGGQEYVGVGNGAPRALLRRTPHLGIGRRHVYVGAARPRADNCTLPLAHRSGARDVDACMT